MDETEIIFQDTRIPHDVMMFSDTPYDAGPQFRITEMCRFFFNRTSHWLRWLEEPDETKGKPNYLMLDGKPVGTRKGLRPGSKEKGTGSRIFSLRDVEEIAHALANNNRIDSTQFYRVLILLHTLAEIHGVAMNQGGEEKEDPAIEELKRYRDGEISILDLALSLGESEESLIEALSEARGEEERETDLDDGEEEEEDEDA